MISKRNWAAYNRKAVAAIRHDEKKKAKKAARFLVTTVYENHGIQYENTFEHPIMSIHTFLDMLERGEVEEVRIRANQQTPTP